MNFPQKLQQYRRTAKLSQEELADRLGVSRQSVSKWEQGLSFPETEKLIELSTMMGVSIDSLLKDDADLTPKVDTSPVVQAPAVQKNWLTILLAILLAVTLFALILVIGQDRDDPSATEPTPSAQSAAEPSNEESAQQEGLDTSDEVTVSTESSPESMPTEPGFDNKDLRGLQRWFFDFAREYRLDYMPEFTREDGAPRDAGVYLDWAFVINLDNWGDEKGKMSKSYVEETVLMYYGVIPQQHRSHRKSWDYDTKTETYTAYPGSVAEPGYYLLNSIEVDQGYYTVHAVRYYSPSYGFSPEEEEQLITALFEGANTELIPVSEVTVTFHLDHVFHRPVFYTFTEHFLTDIVS